jgi:site-specific DNA-methyltransferase (adenine-specific)
MATLRFLQGDCLEVMPTLADKSIDCFICDLPYGCLSAKPLVIPNTENAHRKACPATDRQGCDWDIKIDLVKFWEQVKRLAKNDNTPVLMFCTTKFGADLIASNPDWFRYDLVWSKPSGTSFLMANKMPLRSHEMIYVFSKKGAFYKRVDILGDFKASSAVGNVGGSVYDCSNGGRKQPIKRNGTREGIRCVKSVVEIANKRAKGNHPTQKPAELYEWLLKRYCPEGGTILDPTAGSFASCFVAKTLGLNAIGIEKDEKFYEKANLTNLGNVG